MNDAKDSAVRDRPVLGFTGPLNLVFLVGVVLVVLAGLLLAIDATGGPGGGLGDAAVWLGWLGGTAMSVTLLSAGLTGNGAPAGVRAALLLVGSYLLLAVTSIVGGIF